MIVKIEISDNNGNILEQQRFVISRYVRTYATPIRIDDNSFLTAIEFIPEIERIKKHDRP